MKIFSAIFSIYILALAFLPCGDVKDCRADEAVNSPLPETEHSDHQEDTETCSPFCICACCGTNIGYNLFFSTYSAEKQPVLISQKLISVYRDDLFSSNFFGNIWQPPKI
jgi:hypothetical protein